MSAADLQVVRAAAGAQAEAARAQMWEAEVVQANEHAASVAELARNLAGAVAGLSSVPAATVNHLLLAVATFAEKGGKQG